MIRQQELVFQLVRAFKPTTHAQEVLQFLHLSVHASLGILSSQTRFARSFVVMEKLGLESLVMMEVLEDAQQLVLRLVLTINVLEAQSLQPRLAHA
jgi:hypothetical protein